MNEQEKIRVRAMLKARTAKIGVEEIKRAHKQFRNCRLDLHGEVGDKITLRDCRELVEQTAR